MDKGDIETPTAKAFVGNNPWIKTQYGWNSGRYVDGWICEDGRWWYVYAGYTYPAGEVVNINGKDYAFDADGWIITSDRIGNDGAIIY